jgi:hypothetical protein
MDPRWEIRAFLRVFRDAWTPEQAEALGLVYRGPADFVLRHGRWWRPAGALPDGVEPGLPGRCYGNSIAGAVLHGLRYVQGWALPASGVLPVAHAWNADADGRAVDLTWPEPGRAYLGVEFSVERADDATWNGDADVLDDHRRDWPLLREPWRGETPPDPAWTPSPALLALRARAAGDDAEVDRQMERARAEAGVELERP